MSEYRGPEITHNLYDLYLLVGHACMGLQSDKQNMVMKWLGHELKEKYDISKADIRKMEDQFDVVHDEDTDSETSEEEEYKDRCCVCQDELFFGAEATNCIGTCSECHQEICEASACSKLSEDDKLYCLTCWKIKEEDGEPTIGNCGFRCDGHCQTCDPGYRYGRYDGADEI